MVLLILTKYILLNYIINRIGKKVSKNTGKKLNKKTRQSSKTYISDFKHECGKMFLMKFCQHGSNFRQKLSFQTKSFWSIRSGKVRKNPPPPLSLSHPLSKDEGLKDIGHIMSIGNLILDVKIVTVSYLMHCDSLLQNVKDSIKKCYSYFITKCDRSLLQNASALL